MRSFLDSCIIINFLEFEFNETPLKKKCLDYLSKEKDFLSCFWVLEETKTFIRKREVQFNELLRKKEDPSYNFGTHKESELLSKNDLLFTKLLYDDLKEIEISALKDKFEQQIKTLKIKRDLFLKNQLNEISIKISEINKTILSIIYDFIEDYSDCKVLTSAIQMQQDKEIFTFVTADKHFLEGTYDSINEDMRLKEYKKPILKNLLFEN